ncbi:MAG: serine protease [Hydrogenophilales bacterium CG17_big_fil_post_rev_8_21_14_2_50_63_12]|nr:MAG: serine protease [Hydrogenophilales bacterium CG17_big_fil_post_rev_8_21_14_2_50_63_12]PIX95804.1 MAG: serine protease [Hydrogenophilales bacterium CG_4_10_14_3_um_filter_63_21]PJB07770.1 MAG: serine protease [Hydrogenophilales bacterium CG_4_9_14_3_um_filter_63_34]
MEGLPMFHLNVPSLAAAIGIFLAAVAQADIVDLLPRIKPAVVGVGSQHPLRSPRTRMSGTGFVVADGRHVITNAHVPPTLLETEKGETLAVLLRGANGVEVRRAEKVMSDPDHDLLLLKIDGEPLPALKLGHSDQAREGQQFYFTGYPIGAVLGLYPATHHAGLAAVVPIYSPVASVKKLTPRLIRQADKQFMIFQLDATAYPGNSGSPMYDAETGEVMAVVNSVFIKGSKESALKDPSGISYAIPVNYVRELLERVGLRP